MKLDEIYTLLSAALIRGSYHHISFSKQVEYIISVWVKCRCNTAVFLAVSQNVPIDTILY